MSTPTVTSQDPTKPPEQPEVELPVTAADEAREEAHVEAEAEKSHERLFKWSQWVHVGAWAQECEKRLTGDCTDEEHFHAWIRLPNPFQIRDITAKARAARARKKKELDDETSDARVTLEFDLQDLAATTKEVIVDEILDKDFADDYRKAVREVDTQLDPDYAPKDEDDEIPKLWEHIDQDREEYERQRNIPEEQRNAEEFKVLEKRVADYGVAIEAELDKIQKPKREALMGRPIMPDPATSDRGLLDIIRQDRIDQMSTEAYLHTYNTWMWFICTYKTSAKGTPEERVFKDLSNFKFTTATEVIQELQRAFESLENKATARSRAVKNS
jgi:hypothetical protein